jgi:hypothetical protein
MAFAKRIIVGISYLVAASSALGLAFVFGSGESVAKLQTGAELSFWAADIIGLR